MNDFPTGRWTRDQLRARLVDFSPKFDRPEPFVQDLGKTFPQASREGFIVAFRELLLDESLSWDEKAAQFLDDPFLEGTQSWDYFKFLWTHLCPGEPWPLEGQERPKD